MALARRTAREHGVVIIVTEMQRRPRANAWGREDGGRNMVRERARGSMNAKLRELT